MGEQGRGSSTDIDELLQFEALLQESTPVERRADAASRRRRIRRAVIGIAVPIALVAASVGGYIAWALNAPLPEPVARAVSAPEVPTTTAAEVLLASSGASAIAVSGGEEFLDTTGEEVWLASGGDEPRPIASITKLVTALVVLDAHPLAADEQGPAVPFGNADVAIYEDYYVRGAALAPVQRGASIPLRDVLATVLIPSASNYATSVARWAFGSDAGFTAAAASWLAERGLSDTRIVDATGLDPRNTSTPSDLLELGRIALADPVIADIVATREMTLDVPGRLVNTNALLSTDGFTGLKTGTLSGSGANVLYSAAVPVAGGMTLDVIGVVLGSPTRSAAAAGARRTIETLRGGFHQVRAVDPGRVITGYTTAWGDEVDVVVGAGASLLVWGDTPIAMDIELSPPIDFEDGEQVGTITWTAGTRSASVPLVVDGEIAPPSDEWRLRNPAVLLDAG